MHVLFRVDASMLIGSGHVMRCLTLANAMREKGWQVSFCSREHPGHQINCLESLGFVCIRLPLLHIELNTTASTQPPEGGTRWLGATEAEDAAAVIQALAQAQLTPDLLVIDHYGLAVLFETSLRRYCGKILVIDDLANRQHDCDVLLDQNLLPNATLRYQNLLPPACLPLIGPSYALLRPEFSQPIAQQRNFSAAPAQLLVFFGGSDGDNLTALAIKALQQLQNLDWLADIVIGSANPHQSLLQQLCEEDHRLTLHVQTPGMAGLMAKAQLMIGGGGATHWERCAMALPAIVVSLAPNQQPTSTYLAKLGACVYLGASTELTLQRLGREIARLLHEPKQLKLMADVASSVVAAEGGCQRLLNALVKVVDHRL